VTGPSSAVADAYLLVGVRQPDYLAAARSKAGLQVARPPPLPSRCVRDQMMTSAEPGRYPARQAYPPHGPPDLHGSQHLACGLGGVKDLRAAQVGAAGRRVSTATLCPSARSRGTTSRPSTPVPP
jgi:hypothetical protein